MPTGLGLNKHQTSLFASLLAVGALFGGPVAGIIIEKLGRKTGIMLSGLPFVAGWFLIAYTNNVYVLYLGRLLTGFACGIASLSAPTYIAEATSKEVRGLLGGGFQLAVVFGVLLAFVFGIPLTYNWLAILSSAAAVLMVVLMLFVPETPRWYYSRDSVKAMKSLRRLRGGDVNINTEFNEMAESVQNQGDAIKFKELFSKPNLYKPLIISVALMFFQQFGGVNAVMFFSDSIFTKAGFHSETEQHMASVILALSQVIFTFVGCILMDRAGRRILLILAGSIMSFTCVTFSLYYILTEKNVVDSNAWYMKALSVGSLGIYISGFSIGWGPIPWLIMSEVFPAKARGVSSGIATACNWTFAFIVTFSFQSLQAAITPYGTFIAFAVVNFLGVVFVALVLPETKGKSLEEIEQHFNTRAHYDVLENDEQEQ